MKKGFLYIANGRVIPRGEELSLEPIQTSTFEAACMYAANELGYKLYEGVNRDYAEQLKGVDYDITFYNQHIYRNIFDIKTIKIGYQNLCAFLEAHPDISVIHCNTPIGGVLGRICGKKYGRKVIYMAHGFHFYKGAPLLNRILFKFIEKWLARKTDCLITINQEDYEAAQSFKLNKGGKVFKVNGVGVDLNSFDGVSVNVKEKRESLGLPKNVVVGIVVGDLNENKNVETIIRSLPLSEANIHILICGFGPLEDELKKLAKDLGVDNRCQFLGFRTDVMELYLASDIFVFASQREGLPRSTMEAMLAGLPCVVSRIRGNIDLIDENKGGNFFLPKDYKSLAKELTMLATDSSLRVKYGAYNKERIKDYDIEVVKKQMLEIYKNII
jgi:glycosyltransferase involved in cell wall biosynthesis